MINEKREKFSKISFILAMLILVVNLFISLPSKIYSLEIVTDGYWDDPSLLGVSKLESYVSNGKEWVDISTPEQLGYLCYNINKEVVEEVIPENQIFRNYNIRLVAHLYMSKHYWTPISVFDETFDGNGFTINNLKIKNEKGSDGHTGFIAYTGYNNNEIKNLTLRNPIIVDKLTQYNGFLVGYADGSTISNCNIISNFTNDTFFTLPEAEFNSLYFGCIAGVAFVSIFENCTAQMSYKINQGSYTFIYAGGIVGSSWNNKITKCSNFSSIEIKAGNYTHLGGIAGSVESRNDNTDYNNIITACANTGRLYAESKMQACIGGIVGDIINIASGQVPEILYCFNRGKISGKTTTYRTNENYKEIDTASVSSYSFGGIQVVGGDYTAKKLQGAYNGKQPSFSYSEGYYCFKGGIVGRLADASAKAISCYNVGDVTETFAYIKDVHIIKLKTYQSEVLVNDFMGIPISNTINSCNGLIKQTCTIQYKTSGNFFGYCNNYSVTNTGLCYINKMKNDTQFSYTMDIISPDSTTNIYSFNSWKWDSTPTIFIPLEIGSDTVDIPLNWTNNIDNYLELDDGFKIDLGKRIAFYCGVGTKDGYFIGNRFYYFDHLDTMYNAVMGSKGVTLANLGDPNGDVWAIEWHINNGLPHIKEKYWIYDTNVPEQI